MSLQVGEGQAGEPGDRGAERRVLVRVRGVAGRVQIDDELDFAIDREWDGDRGLHARGDDAVGVADVLVLGEPDHAAGHRRGDERAAERSVVRDGRWPDGQDLDSIVAADGPEHREPSEARPGLQEIEKMLDEFRLIHRLAEPLRALEQEIESFGRDLGELVLRDGLDLVDRSPVAGERDDGGTHVIPIVRPDLVQSILLPRETDAVARLDLVGLAGLDRHAVDGGAMATPTVRDVPDALFLEELRVAARDGRVGQYDVASGIAPDPHSDLRIHRERSRETGIHRTELEFWRVGIHATSFLRDAAINSPPSTSNLPRARSCRLRKSM